jgi:hypothetical protein
MNQISADELRANLRAGVLEFAFTKKDGTLRLAKGTTQLDQIPSASHPTGARASSANQVPFFDLEKQEWRSVSILQEIYLR